MYLMFTGLLCLSFVSFGRADLSFAKKESETNDEMKVLFSLMDTQIEQDGHITFDEFKQAWLKWDTDGNEKFSRDELNALLHKLNFGYSARAEYLFLDLKLAELEEWFDVFDSDLDGTIELSEYENQLEYYDDIEN